MSLDELFADFSHYLHSEEFRQSARHPDHPNAFTRQRKLPLPSLIAVMLTGLCKSVQAELDQFFAHLRRQALLVREVSEQAFAQARVKLSADALPGLNHYLIARAEQEGWIPRWQGLRLVAADASPLRFGLRASHVPRAAVRDRIAFGLYLPDAEMTLAASLYSIHESERQMLFEHLNYLQEDDLLLMDRGYPCRCLVSVLNQWGIRFCMRVEKSGNSGFGCVRDFLCSGLPEQVVTLRAPDPCDVADFGCPATPQRVRLIRDRTPSGSVRVLMTNLRDTEAFPAERFGDLYHRRWRIEEAFKRLKHRLNLEHVSGLSDQAVKQDFAAKVLCDNLASLVTLAADDLLPEERRINRAYVHTVLKPLLPGVLLGAAALSWLQDAMELIARRTFQYRSGLSKPRKARPKPHKFMNQKPC
ncbi:IS4 family transposase [Marinobacterium sp. D7]|uniref:IS4 family transposase n=1 Tax=Marinobacterium ramblicola TaxID=2849041 RepID=UPI001C2DB2B8|nr:IS4 family transposase [Marinobacterium ramblicola]MBV1790269.1 IS4 family transposase [Marinobacterium ramblicola]